MKIFLGYPSEHERTAWVVYEFLKGLGDQVWFDKVSLVAGVEWDQERLRGQQQAELVVHLCSNEIMNRPGVVNREIRQSLRLVDDQPLGSLYLIAIRLDDIKMPVELTRFQYFDFANDWQARLHDGVERRRAQLHPAPTQDPMPPALTEPSDSIVRAEALSEGIQKVEFEGVTPIYECRGEYLKYPDVGLYWSYLNSAIVAMVLESYFSTRIDFDPLPERDPQFVTEFGVWKHEWSATTEEFYRSNDIVSIRFYFFINYSGAAHPNHYIRSLNFFGEQTGSLSIETVLGYSIENAQKLLSYCENVIVAEFEGEVSGNDFFGDYKETPEDVWKLLSQFNCDDKGMTFNFSPYDVLPFVFGSHEVRVPWRFIEPMVTDKFRRVIETLAR